MKYLFIFTLLTLLNFPVLAFSYWTEWFDRDNPSGTGDWENLVNFNVCSGQSIIDVQARRIDNGLPAEYAGQIFIAYDTTVGFICRNDDQRCSDYEVQFKCQSYWTEWFDRDDPSGTGDWENLVNFNVCSGQTPTGITARRISDKLPAEYTGQTLLSYSPGTGLVCKNDDNNQNCFDYEVRFKCGSPRKNQSDHYHNQLNHKSDIDTQ